MGIRIPVEQILYLLKEGFTIEAIHEEYPQLSKKAIANTIDEAAKLINSHASQIL